MRDPSYWSIPLGRLFGITIRVHVLFPLVVLGLILRVVYPPRGMEFLPGTWVDVTVFCALLFGSVLLHEFGHCFGARAVNGDASEVLLWPLGGLASVDVPHTPGANFLTTLAGPLVNLGLCVLCALLLAFTVDPSYQPPWSPLGGFVRFKLESGEVHLAHLYTWGGLPVDTSAVWPVFLARLFLANWILFLLNVLLPGFPLDGGRLLQSALWRYLGYRQAMVIAIIAGFVCVFVVAVAAIAANDLLPLVLAGFIFLSCRNQWVLLETGGEDSLFGYDFSQGYTSLERDQAPAAPPRRRTGWWKRWLQKRAAQKLQREQETREAEERRLDELLDKVHREGKAALTDEERRFMKRVSDRYRNRN
jgi:stage IV sporulation protein FB